MPVDTGSFSDVSQLTDSSSSGFDLQTQNPLITFQTKQVPPAVPVYITPDDFLRIQIISDTPLTTRIGTARVLRADGKIHTYELDVIVPTAFTTTTFDVALSEGWLLAVALIDQTQQLQRGQCFVTIGIVRNPGPRALWVYTLAADYLTYLVPTGYPGGQVTSSIEGNGRKYQITGANAFDIFMPPHTLIRLINATIQFNTAGVFAQRQAILRLFLGTAQMFIPIIGQVPQGTSLRVAMFPNSTPSLGGTWGPVFITLANPAPGAEFIYNVPNLTWMKLKSLSCVLATSAAAGNRTVYLDFNDDSGVNWQQINALQLVGPSSASAFRFAAGYDSRFGVDGFTQHMPLPQDVVMPQHHMILSQTTGLQAGDQWSSIYIVGEQAQQLGCIGTLPDGQLNLTEIELFSGIVPGLGDTATGVFDIEQWLVP
jgi:hypothetical protein